MNFEFQILDALQTIHTPVLDQIMKFITRLGNSGMIWIILAVVLLLIPKTRRLGIVVTVSLCINTLLCNIILKPLVARIRPYDINTAVHLIIRAPRDYSFPSGHTAASFAAAGALFFSYAKKHCIPAFIVAGLIAFSRLYLYVHYPTDILGGVAVGLFSAFAASRLVKNSQKF